jgi:hypothetical protein
VPSATLDAVGLPSGANTADPITASWRLGDWAWDPVGWGRALDEQYRKSWRWFTFPIAWTYLAIEEVEQVLHDPANRPTVSRSTGRPAVFGATATGKDILVVYEVLETECAVP